MKKQELNYYDEFIKNIEIAYQISNILKEYIDKFKSEDSEEIEQKVHKLENDADYNLHNLNNYLVKDFLPPIDREDIIILVNKIDDVIDNLDEIVIDFNILNVTELRGDINAFIDLICKISLKLKDMMNNFKNIKKYDETKKLIIDINNLEEQGDKLYENAIKNLYNTQKDAVEILKWDKIYECIENCIDSRESVADCVEEVLMKNV